MLQSVREEIEKSLCTTCKTFDWVEFLRRGHFKPVILHLRFETVLQSAAAGCRLCGFVADEHAKTNYEDNVKESQRNCTIAVRSLGYRDAMENRATQIAFYLGQPDEEGRDPRTGFKAADPEFTVHLAITVPPPYWRDFQTICAFRSWTPIPDLPRHPHPDRFQIFLAQFNSCIDTFGHKSCKWWSHKELHSMPTRVVDCSELRLVETQNLHGGRARILAPWAALSHCWGAKPGLVTTSANYQDLLRSISLDSLPATIRDAILLAWTLGHRYLWIDSLCIIQSQDHIEEGSQRDWEMELPRMHHYYRNAAVTFIIESAHGDDEGFLAGMEEGPQLLAAALDHSGSGTSQDPLEASLSQIAPIKIPCYFTDGFEAVVYFHHNDDINPSTVEEAGDFFSKSTPLRDRAWTLQETVLSPRKIHIHNNELVWSCNSWNLHDRLLLPLKSPHGKRRHRFLEEKLNEQIAREANMSDELSGSTTQATAEPYLLWWRSFDSKALRRVLRLEGWYSYVADHQSRKVTVSSDKLPAISAIAQHFMDELHLKYYGGLWIEDIARGLAWVTDGGGVRPPVWRAPSWSWASIDRSLHERSENRQQNDMHFFIEDEHALQIVEKPLDLDIFAALVAPAALRVKAEILRFDRWTSPGSIANVRRTDSSDPMSDTRWKTSSFIERDLKDDLICEFDEERYDREYTPDDLEGLVLLRLGTWVLECWLPWDQPGKKCAFALMLRGNSDGTYSRVGISQVPCNAAWWERGWELQELTLV